MVSNSQQNHLGPDDLRDTPLLRDATPLRVSFLHPLKARGGTGPLASFVSARRELALDLFLLAHAVTTEEGQTLARPSVDWAEVLGFPEGPSARSAVSRAWTWLEAEALIETVRRGRCRAIRVLREDGSGEPYQHPAASGEPYLKLPHAYWVAGWQRRLTLAAKATLLIALSLQPNKARFELPVERGAEWYGLSPKSLGRGIRELRREGVLWTWTDKRETVGSPIGYAYDRQYALTNLYSAAWRHS